MPQHIIIFNDSKMLAEFETMALKKKGRQAKNLPVYYTFFYKSSSNKYTRKEEDRTK